MTKGSGSIDVAQSDEFGNPESNNNTYEMPFTNVPAKPVDFAPTRA
jgi:hypothetical protein